MLQPQTALSTAETCLPFFDSDNQRKRNYLSYRICGFSRLEARKLAPVTMANYKSWIRHDTRFREIEERGLLELSKEFRTEVLALEYTRNFKLAIDKDAKILRKSLRNQPLSKNEHEYLLKIRPLYTPQALKALEEMFSGSQNPGFGNWEEILVWARRNGNASVGYERGQEPVYQFPAYSGLEELDEGSVDLEDESEDSGFEAEGSTEVKVDDSDC